MPLWAGIIPALNNLNGINVKMAKKIKSNNERRLHFGCNKCGKCCTSDPEMEIAESFKFASTIPNIPMLIIEPFPKNPNKLGFPEFIEKHEPKVKNFRKLMHKGRVKAYGGNAVKIGGAGTYIIRLTAYPKSLTSEPTGKCSKLSDDGCSIHADKPLMCHLVPGSIHSAAQVDYYITKDFIENYGCESDKTQNLIYKGNDFTESYRNIRSKIIEQRNVTFDIARVYLSHLIREFMRSKPNDIDISDKESIDILIKDIFQYRAAANHPIVFSGLVHKGLINRDGIELWTKENPDSNSNIVKNIDRIVSGEIYEEALELA